MAYFVYSGLPMRLVVLGIAGLVAYAVPVWLLDRERIMQTAALLRGGR